MNCRPTVTACLLFTGLAVAQEASFRTDVQLVNVSLSVRDVQGGLVAGLGKERL